MLRTSAQKATKLISRISIEKSQQIDRKIGKTVFDCDCNKTTIYRKNDTSKILKKN